MKKNKIIPVIIITFIPIITFAQNSILGSNPDVRSVSDFALGVVSMLMQTLFAVISLAVIYTAWKYISALNSGDAKAATESRKILIGAIIGLAVSFSLWGIIGIFSETLGWTNFGIPEFTEPTPSSK